MTNLQKARIIQDVVNHYVEGASKLLSYTDHRYTTVEHADVGYDVTASVVAKGNEFITTVESTFGCGTGSPNRKQSVDGEIETAIGMLFQLVENA